MLPLWPCVSGMFIYKFYLNYSISPQIGMPQRNNKGKEEINSPTQKFLKERHLKVRNFPNKILTNNKESWEFSPHFRKTSGTLPSALASLGFLWCVSWSLRSLAPLPPFHSLSLLLFLCFALLLLQPTSF